MQNKLENMTIKARTLVKPKLKHPYSFNSIIINYFILLKKYIFYS